MITTVYTTRTVEAAGIWQGEDVEWIFVADEEIAPGTITWKLTAFSGREPALITKTASIFGAQFKVDIASEEIAALKPGTYWHEAKFTSIGGDTSQVIAPSPIYILESAT